MQKSATKKMITGGVILSVLAGVAFLGATLTVPRKSAEDVVLSSSDAQASEHLVATSSGIQSQSKLGVDSSGSRITENKAVEISVVDSSDTPVIENTTVGSSDTEVIENQIATLSDSGINSPDIQTFENPDFNPSDINSIFQPTTISAVNDFSSSIEGCVVSTMVGGCKVMNQMPFFNVMFQQWAAATGMTCPVARVN